MQPLLKDPALRNIIVASHLIKWVGLEGGAAFLKAVTGKDAFAEVYKFKEIASELFLFGDDDLHVHSAVFSEYLIDNFFDSDDVVDTIYTIIVEAVRRKKERRYQAIMSKMMQVSTIKRVVKSSINKDILLTSLFDRMHRDVEVNNEPLFWLQYSILMMDYDDLIAVERFLETSYSRANAIPGFRTFQIDTHALRLLLRIEQAEPSAANVERFDKIMEMLDKVVSMTNEPSHRAFTLKVVIEIEPFLEIRMPALSGSERNALLVQIDRLILMLQRAIEQNRPFIDDENMALESVNRSKAILLKG